MAMTKSQPTDGTRRSAAGCGMNHPERIVPFDRCGGFARRCAPAAEGGKSWITRSTTSASIVTACAIQTSSQWGFPSEAAPSSPRPRTLCRLDSSAVECAGHAAAGNTCSIFAPTSNPVDGTRCGTSSHGLRDLPGSKLTPLGWLMYGISGGMPGLEGCRLVG